MNYCPEYHEVIRYFGSSNNFHEAMFDWHQTGERRAIPDGWLYEDLWARFVGVPFDRWLLLKIWDRLEEMR